MEILRRNVGLRDGNVELQFDGEHEIHHLQGAHAQVAELRIEWKRIRGGAGRSQNYSYDRNEPLAYAVPRMRIQ